VVLLTIKEKSRDRMKKGKNRQKGKKTEKDKLEKN
jgi:hypothetical protein